MPPSPAGDRSPGEDRRPAARAQIQPSPALVAARDDVSKLIVQWDDALADKIAAENLFLDRSKDRRRGEIEGLRSKVGACTAPTKFDYVENALRGQWTMSCERGALQVVDHARADDAAERAVPRYS